MLASFIMELGVQRFQSVVGHLIASIWEMVLTVTMRGCYRSKEGGYVKARLTFGEACKATRSVTIEC